MLSGVTQFKISVFKDITYFNTNYPAYDLFRSKIDLGNVSYLYPAGYFFSESKITSRFQSYPQNLPFSNLFMGDVV